MNQLSSWQSFRSLRAQRSNPDLPSLRGAERRSNLLAYTLVILCFVFAPVQARTLNLAKQKIKDISKLKVKEGVTKLKLQKNKITSIAPLKLPSTLKTLNLSFNKITDLSELQLNSNLDSLVAYGNEITTIDGLNLPEGLRYLTLSNNENLNDIYTLQLSPSLEELRLLFCNISDSEMNGLVLNANLDTLNLAFNNLTTLDG
ncbi:MAG: leucine-rich repeat domain-containing protein, partial [Candidatus Melainabacteria bacterium]|nr:leucine-rich repeat domain-containing protein [Candidatus Melainabacteria bacterium]